MIKNIVIPLLTAILFIGGVLFHACNQDDVPDSMEWATLASYLGGNNIAGGKMKETGTEYWGPPNTGATNGSGFSGIPAGHIDGSYGGYGLILWGCWWSSTVVNEKCIYVRLESDKADLIWDYSIYNDGFNVRCIKD